MLGTYYSTCKKFIQEAKSQDFSPKAIVMTGCVDGSTFLSDLGVGFCACFTTDAAL
jgi:hypothetical protein